MFVLNISFDVQAYVQRLLAQFGIYNAPIQNEPQEDVSAQNDAIFEDLNSRLLQMRGNNISLESNQSPYVSNASTVESLEHNIETIQDNIDPTRNAWKIKKEIMQKLEEAGSLELQFITRSRQSAPIAMANYLNEKGKRENEIARLVNEVKLAEIALKSYTYEYGDIEERITKQDTLINETKEKLPPDIDQYELDGHGALTDPNGNLITSKEKRAEIINYLNLNAELKSQENEKKRLEEINYQVKKNEKTIEDSNKRIEELKAQGPTEQEIELLKKANDEYVKVSTMKDDLNGVFGELVELRKELDQALGRPVGNYNSYLANPNVSSFSSLAMALFGVVPIRELGPSYSMPDRIDIYFQPFQPESNDSSQIISSNQF